MDAKPLYQVLLELMDRGQWLDRRHLQTAVSMVVGLIGSGKISLTEWMAFTLGRAVHAQSGQRRLARWVRNRRIQAREL